MKKKTLTYEAQLREMGVQINNVLSRINGLKINAINPPREYFTFESLIQDLDVQQYCNRYRWNNLPDNLSSWIIEAMLYYKGSLCGFKIDQDLLILPYSQTGDINAFGMPSEITPISYNGTSYGVKPLPVLYNGFYNKDGKAVLLYDKIPQFGTNATPLPRFVRVSDLIHLMDKTLGKTWINLQNSVKKLTYEIDSEGQQRVQQGLINSAMESDDPYVLVLKGTEEGSKGIYNNGVELETEKIMQFYTSLNNLRCETMGIKNNGTFEKNDRVVVGELTGNDVQSNSVIDAGLMMRRLFLEQLKSLYPDDKKIQAISVEINDAIYEQKDLRSNANVKDTEYNINKEKELQQDE